MTATNFLALSNYFKFIPVEYGKDEKIDIAFRKILPEIVEREDWKYGTAFMEVETGNILGIGIDFENHRAWAAYENELFRHYLQQLPDLELKNVDFFFYLVGSRTKLDNAFKMPENYPSQFAFSVLSETYGQILYDYQFIELMRCCKELSLDEKLPTALIDFRKHFNTRRPYLFEKLKTLHLPDGTNLFKLIADYTPNGRNGEQTMHLGFLTHPSYQYTYEFINLAKKYL